MPNKMLLFILMSYDNYMFITDTPCVLLNFISQNNIYVFSLTCGKKGYEFFNRPG